MLRFASTVAGICLSTAALAHEVAAPSTSSDRSFRVAQACGWYTITSCAKRKDDADRELQKLQKCCRATKTYPRVIRTDDFPNFSAGWYCVVVGPDTQEAAKLMADGYRGNFPTVYVKNSC